MGNFFSPEWISLNEHFHFDLATRVSSRFGTSPRQKLPRLTNLEFPNPRCKSDLFYIHLTLCSKACCDADSSVGTNSTLSKSLFSAATEVINSSQSGKEIIRPSRLQRQCMRERSFNKEKLKITSYQSLVNCRISFSKSNSFLSSVRGNASSWRSTMGRRCCDWTSCSVFGSLEQGCASCDENLSSIDERFEALKMELITTFSALRILCSFGHTINHDEDVLTTITNVDQRNTYEIRLDC
jgi:hypothetical protein